MPDFPAFQGHVKKKRRGEKEIEPADPVFHGVPGRQNQYWQKRKKKRGGKRKKEKKGREDGAAGTAVPTASTT